jgi:hypothetical protein
VYVRSLLSILALFVGGSDCQAVDARLGCASDMDAETALQVGLLVDTGVGVRQDFSMAVQCYRRAALAQNRRAEFNLAAMYAKGRGVERDPQQAAFWYQQAAEQGDGRAAYVLGVMNEQGDGIKPDKKEALKWYRVALDNGVPAAKRKIASLIPKADVTSGKVQPKGGAPKNGQPPKDVPVNEPLKDEKDSSAESGSSMNSLQHCRAISTTVVIADEQQAAYAVVCDNGEKRWILTPR